MSDKKCLRCGEQKSTSCFYKDKRRKNRLRSRCIDCLKKERKKYCENNKDKRKQYQLEYQPRASSRMRERYHSDIQFRLSRLFRGRVRDALRNGGVSYTKRSGGKLLGCSYERYKEYLSELFTEGMSWEGVLCGEIHIDHIKPCSSFDLTKEEERKKCFHFSNTQPLWAKDNLQKSKKIIQQNVR